MLQYIEHIIVPYVEKIREDVGDDKASLVIIDNFKGQITTQVSDLLKRNNIFVKLLPLNTTDLLQPMDISVNKPAKEYLQRQFQEWYSEEVMRQLDGRDVEDLATAEVQPTSLGMPILKEVEAQWLVGMTKYTSDNPQFIVNGFICSGITGAVDGQEWESDDETANSGDASTEDFTDLSDEETMH